MSRDNLIEIEDKETELEMRKVAHLTKVMDIGFLLGNGKSYEDFLEMEENKKGGISCRT